MTVQLPDEQLMIRYVNGDDRAFDELYRRYKGKVYGFITSKTKPGVVDEIFQQVFLKLHRSRESYDAKYPFATWLFSICRNTIKDHYRYESRRPETLIDQMDQITSGTAETQVSDKAIELEKAVASLPLKQREIIQMRFSEGLEFEEIAARQKTSQENIRKIVSRAVQVLKKSTGKANE